MKKIDLHIHTISTVSDPPFVFSLDVFSKYVSEARIDAVAVTNHDIFDLAQFVQIQNTLKTSVYPGIEVSVENGHLLVIADPKDLDGFSSKAELVSRKINKQGDFISLDEFLRIYGDLNQYLLIPHSDKSPSISGETMERLRPHVSAGEVDSPKKFIRAIRENSKLTPVLFSDARMREGLTQLPTRQTFVDCGAPTLSALKATLRDKSKVALSESDGNRLWQVFDNGQKLSTGLNVVIGARSSGKTHTLNAIRDASESVKFIQQFSLVQDDEAASEKAFKGSIERKRSSLADEHLSSLKQVLEVVVNVDIAANHKRVERYVSSLLKSAAELDRHDSFSKAALYSEEEFPAVNVQTLVSLIEAVRHVIENSEFRPVIETYLDLRSVKALARH